MSNFRETGSFHGPGRANILISIKEGREMPTKKRSVFNRVGFYPPMRKSRLEMENGAEVRPPSRNASGKLLKALSFVFARGATIAEV